MENSPKISQEELELMERFWSGTFVNATEEAELKERYERDTLWHEKADWVRLSMLAIQETALESKLNNFHRALNIEKTNNQMGWIKWCIAASITAIFITGGILFFSKSSEEKLFAQYYKPDPGLPTLMGASDHYKFEEAMVDYKTGNYPKAIATWKQLLGKHHGNDTLHYFIGSAYLAKGTTDSAVTNFKQVIAQPQSSFYSDAQWYLSLAWLKAGKLEEAKISLKKAKHPNKDHLLNKLSR